MTSESPARDASSFLRANRDRLAAEIAARVSAQFSDDTESLRVAIQKSVHDVGHDLMYLTEALWAGEPSLLANYVSWARVAFTNMQLDDQVFQVTWTATQAILQEQMPSELAEVTREYIGVALSQKDEVTCDVTSYLDPSAPHVALARTYMEHLLRGERRQASQLIMDAVAGGVGIKDIYLHVFQRSQYEIGRLWQLNEVTVAQEHYATAATQLIMSQLYPNIFSTERVGKRMVATSVGGELHEIGIRMVADFFELEGWDTYYLGANSPADSVAEAVVANAADLLAVSVTLTPHVHKVVEIIDAVRQRRPSTKVIVGGYPFNIAAGLWREVGADGHAVDATDAVRLGNQLIQH